MNKVKCRSLCKESLNKHFYEKLCEYLWETTVPRTIAFFGVVPNKSLSPSLDLLNMTIQQSKPTFPVVIAIIITAAVFSTACNNAAENKSSTETTATSAKYSTNKINTVNTRHVVNPISPAPGKLKHVIGFVN
jgi:hypothetical protein